MIEKQQQLTFNKGITNVPSDAICGDGELSSLVGLTSENGELKPIQDPVLYISSVVDGGTTLSKKPKILHIHKSNNQERFICAVETNRYGTVYYVLKWGTVSNGVYSISGSIPASSGALAYNQGAKITSVGNTLIISDSNGITYILWTGSNYTYLGNRLPEPTVELCLDNTNRESGEFLVEGMINLPEQSFYWDIIPGQENAYNDAVIGAYHKVLRSLHQKKMFANPIVARTAVELYDGSYVLHSSPIVLFPLFKPKTLTYIYAVPTRLVFSLFGQKLYFKMSADFEGWEDIIRNVVLFVSKEIPVFDTTKDATINYISTNISTSFGWYIAGTSSQLHSYTDTVYPDRDHYNVLQTVPDSEVASNIEETSLFFKLCELGKNGTNGEWRDTSELIKTNTIENIEAQQQLPNDDFYSHCNLYAEYMYAYNNRLHLANASRSLFEGFTNFMPYDTANSYTYTIYTHIHTASGDKWVAKSFTTRQSMGNYFFYPDPRAFEAKIFYGNTLVADMTLKEHPSLNGAYYFGGLPSTDSPGYAPAPSGSTSSTPFVDNYTSELLENMLIVSEVDNPFTFLPKGYVSVGNGKILGMAAVTMALSEYQHGNHPLVVFASDGVWSLTVTSDGYYSRSQATSREVCNNPSSITQVDNGIFFSSAKGLMYLDTGGVRCVSTQLKGTDFDKFIDNCMIAYDYRDSLLHIYHRDSEVFEYTYVYNMKTGTFSQLLDRFDNVVNNYPDTLVQYEDANEGWKTYSFLQKPDEQADGYNSGGAFVYNTYSGFLQTRPMKLENALALKSIMEVRHIHALSSTAGLSFKVFASNNLDKASNTWVQLTSLRGTPWKYYKFQYTFTGLKATDRYAGTLVVTQERRLDKLR